MKTEFKAEALAALEIVSDRSLSPSEYEFARAVVRLAQYAEVSISTAESLTGGMLAELLTAVPGASSCFKAGIVAYTPEIKGTVLSVPSRMLGDVVTADVAAEMAKGVGALSDCDLALACTGVAGPSRVGRHEVGEVHIALSASNQIRTVSLNFSGSRDEIRVQTCIAIFGLAIDWLLNQCDLERPEI